MNTPQELFFAQSDLPNWLIGTNFAYKKPIGIKKQD